MFLPGILSLLIASLLQGPASAPWTVAAGGGDVAPAELAIVRTELEPAMTELRRWFPPADLPGGRVSPFRVVLHAAASDLPPPLRAMHHEGSPGFALLARHEIHLLAREIARNGRGLRPVLVHELAHELLSQRLGRFGHSLPRWFHEGLAQVLAGDTYLGVGEEMIVWRVASGQYLPFSELVEGFPRDPSLLQAAYAQSYSYVSWLERRLGMSGLLSMLDRIDEDISFDLALVHATGDPTVVLLDAWRDYVVNGSGARWRVLLQQFFSISMVLALPLLALALIRRLGADRQARERLADGERRDAEVAARAAALREQARAELYGPFPPPGFDAVARSDDAPGRDAPAAGRGADGP
ncbi:MAG: hypothetical protein AB7O97_11950 [Planctomycetota bacterium]